MPIPSASSKILWPCSNFFDRVQYFFNIFKCYILSYIICTFENGQNSLVKNIWPHLENIERSQPIFFELAHGLGINVSGFLMNAIHINFAIKNPKIDNKT